jgi:hypothetical protein
MPRTNLRALLTGGDRRSMGNPNRVGALVLADTTLLAPLVRHMSASDPRVCMRAPDALEKDCGAARVVAAALHPRGCWDCRTKLCNLKCDGAWR